MFIEHFICVKLIQNTSHVFSCKMISASSGVYIGSVMSCHMARGTVASTSGGKVWTLVSLNTSEYWSSTGSRVSRVYGWICSEDRDHLCKNWLQITFNNKNITFPKCVVNLNLVKEFIYQRWFFFKYLVHQINFKTFVGAHQRILSTQYLQRFCLKIVYNLWQTPDTSPS